VNTIFLIARRELQGYLYSASGYIIIAALLLLDGLAFNALAMSGEKYSFEVLQTFFYFSSGMVTVGAILFSMRLFAEEKQTGTLVLLQSSPATDLQLVLGKFFGGYAFLLIFLALTLYMPLLIFVNGKVTWGHLLVGYIGLALLGAAVTALGTLASAMAKNQLMAAVLSSVTVAGLFLAWMVARKIDGPLGEAVGYLDLFDKHFRTITRGTLRFESATYFLSLTYLGLLGAVGVLSARRWRG